MDDQAIRRAVRKLPKNAFLVIEDIDALFKERKGEETNVTFSGMLNILDGIVKNTGTKQCATPHKAYGTSFRTRSSQAS